MSQPGRHATEPFFFRISLRGAMMLTMAAAVALAGFGANDKLWSAVLTNLNIAALVASAVTAIYAPGQARAFCVGFLFGDGLVTLFEFIPAMGRPLLHNMLAWQLWHPQSMNQLASAGVERAYVGALLTGWLYGCLAGLLAVWLRQKHARSLVVDE